LPSNGYDETLGGRDLDLSFAKVLARKVSKVQTASLISAILTKSCKAKELLSRVSTVKIFIEGGDERNGSVVSVTPEDLENCWENEFHQVKQLLDKVEVRTEDISNLLLLGGSCRIPAFREMICEKFCEKKSCSLPDEAVVIGAALCASEIEPEIKSALPPAIGKRPVQVIPTLAHPTQRTESGPIVWSTRIERSLTKPEVGPVSRCQLEVLRDHTCWFERGPPWEGLITFLQKQGRPPVCSVEGDVTTEPLEGLLNPIACITFQGTARTGQKASVMFDFSEAVLLPHAYCFEIMEKPSSAMRWWVESSVDGREWHRMHKITLQEKEKIQKNFDAGERWKPWPLLPKSRTKYIRFVVFGLVKLQNCGPEQPKTKPADFSLKLRGFELFGNLFLEAPNKDDASTE
jgi:hypothetical protein